MQLDWLLVPQGTVTLQSIPIQFQAFEVSIEPVSVGQYQAFSQASGYMTYLEKQGLQQTYKRNASLMELASDYPCKTDVPALYLTTEDIGQFVEWTGFLLPSILQAIVIARIFADKFKHQLIFSSTIDMPARRWFSDIMPAFDEEGDVIIVDASQIAPNETISNFSSLVWKVPVNVYDPRVGLHIIKASLC